MPSVKKARHIIKQRVHNRISSESYELHVVFCLVSQLQPPMKNCQFGVTPVNYSGSDRNMLLLLSLCLGFFVILFIDVFFCSCRYFRVALECRIKETVRFTSLLVLFHARGQERNLIPVKPVLNYLLLTVPRRYRCCGCI